MSLYRAKGGSAGERVLYDVLGCIIIIGGKSLYLYRDVDTQV